MCFYVSILQNNSTTGSFPCLKFRLAFAELRSSTAAACVNKQIPEGKSARDIITITFWVLSYFIVSVCLLFTASMLIAYKLTYEHPGLTR